MNNDEILVKIKEELNSLQNKDFKTSSIWTTVLLKKFGELGCCLGYVPYPYKSENTGEWLVDLCWSKEKDNWQETFTGLKLACEIEWARNIDEILYDFMKLTVIRADIRLMIIQYDREEELEGYIRKISKAARYTFDMGYQYLIAASGNDKGDMVMKFFNINSDNDYQQPYA